MTETPLRKVLRLAGGITQSYVHIVHGKPVTVSAYRTPHQRQQLVPTGPPVKSVSWGSLRPGETVVIRSIPYRVMKINVQANHPVAQGKAAKGQGLPQTKGRSTGRQGSGLNTASNFAVSKNATAQRQANNAAAFGTAAQSPQAALLQGSGAPGKAAHSTVLLQQPKTGQFYYVSVPTSTMVNVMG